VQVQTDRRYEVEYTGTPPKKQRFKLTGSPTGAGTELRIKYPESGAYEIWVNNKLIKANSWDEALGEQSVLAKNKGCGENRFVGVKNILDVFITNDCEFEIRPRDAVLCNVRMEWTVAAFYADGGNDKFADRVAAALNIHKSRVKVVAVYKGSVIVQYHILNDVNDTNPTATNQALRAQIWQKT